MKSKKIISIVSPCYNEEENILECYQRVKDVFDNLLEEYDYEHIFSDNNSEDGTLSVLKNIAKKDRKVKIIVNSRNFGVLPSTFNAILRTSGDGIIPMLSADLQDPPEIIPDFVRKWEEGYEVVSGSRKNREEGFIKRSLRIIYYRIVNKISDFNIPNDVGEYQLIDRVVVNALKQFEDYNPYIRGMISNCGFKSTIVKYKHAARKKGKSKFNFYVNYDFAMNGLISFSRVPLRIAFMLGILISFLSLLYAIYLSIDIILYGGLVDPGIASILIGQFIFFGIILIFLGIIGEYISAIHTQVRKKPLVIEREIINF